MDYCLIKQLGTLGGHVCLLMSAGLKILYKLLDLDSDPDYHQN